MAGKDPTDLPTMAQPDVTLDGAFDEDLSGVRLGVYWQWFEDADPGVVTACGKMLEHLKSKGAEVVDIEIPELNIGQLVHLVTIVLEMRASQMPYMQAHKKDYSLETRMNLALASGLGETAYVHAQRIRKTRLQPV